MTANRTATVIITLNMDEHEARWLLNIMQNPIGNIPPELEDETEKALRANLFEILGDTLPRQR